MKIYTKTGDSGTTSLVGGTRISKDDIRLDAYGTVDELNSWIGFLLSYDVPDIDTVHFLQSVQHKLFDIGCNLATELDSKWSRPLIMDSDIKLIEEAIDRIEKDLPTHDKFILPGGTKASCIANIARTVCRRAERETAKLSAETCPGQVSAKKYLNRLSDYLFVLSRYLNFISGKPEIFWEL